MHGWLSSYLKFLNTLAPLVLFCNVLEILFQNLFANSQRYMNKILRSIFKEYIFEIGGGAVLLLWPNTFSPFGMNRQKRILESKI
jgi:hypothetical protein